MTTIIERLTINGIRRKGSKPDRFRYIRDDGAKVGRAEAERIARLGIPPAWRDVRIASSPSASVQAIGRDARGRWQYRYHESAVRRREHRKYERLVRFVAAMPALRSKIGRELRGRSLGRERVLAVIVRILSTCFLRPGSSVYAAENGSFGIATLRRKHVAVSGSRVLFDFPGKSGKQQVHVLEDAAVARVIRRLLALPGHEVFKYEDADGKLVDVRRRHINEYLVEVMGQRFTAKDFRTWAGTLICASLLAASSSGAVGDQRGAKKHVTAAVRETARHLGNTPAVCRSSYIAPTLFQAFEKGDYVRERLRDIGGLTKTSLPALRRCEQALLVVLRGAFYKPVRSTRSGRAPRSRSGPGLR